MKKMLSFAMLLIFSLSLAACRGNVAPPAEEESVTDLLDAAAQLPSSFSEELLDKCIPESEKAYNVSIYRERKNEDYIESLRGQYAEVAKNYDEKYGEGWSVTYTVSETVEKDAEGIEKYKDFDNYFFTTYEIDLDKVDAVTFVKVTVRVEGPNGSGEKDRTVQCFRLDGRWYSFYSLGFAANI